MTTNQNLPRREWLELAYHRLTTAIEYAEQARRYLETADAAGGFVQTDIGLQPTIDLLRHAQAMLRDRIEKEPAKGLR